MHSSIGINTHSLNRSGCGQKGQSGRHAHTTTEWLWYKSRKVRIEDIVRAISYARRSRVPCRHVRQSAPRQHGKLLAERRRHEGFQGILEVSHIESARTELLARRAEKYEQGKAGKNRKEEDERERRGREGTLALNTWN